MSEDEIIVLIASGVVTLLAIVSWYIYVNRAALAPFPGHWRIWLGLAPAACLAGIITVLLTLAASDVRTAPHYVMMYALLGGVWLAGAIRVFSVCGVSFRDDAIERRNPAAAIVTICALGGAAAIYSGANVGDGPGWWVVVFSSLLGAAAWFGLWLAVEGQVEASEQITVGRDTGAAIRLGGYLLGSGLVIARGVAGDWVSPMATVTEFWVAWPAVLLAVLAIVVERVARGRLSVLASLGVALFHVALAVLAVAVSPQLSQNPLYDQPPIFSSEVEIR